MIETKLRKGTFQHIEHELMDYFETKREIVRLRNDILYSSPSLDTEGGSRGNLPSDPTGRKATLLVTHRKLEQMERIVEAIESVVENLPDEKRRLLKLRYWDRPCVFTWEGIARNLHISKRQAMRWRDEIVYAIADKLGWR